MHRKKDEPQQFTGRLVGYARVSTAEQSVEMQIEALKRAGVHEDNIWHEQMSGVKQKRPQLEMALIDARKGDVFVVYKLDRLGRSMRDLLEKVHDLTSRGVGFRSLTEGFDTTTPGGTLLFHVLASLAQFERDLIKERTRDGMAAAKRRGVRVGAPKFFNEARQKEFWRRFPRESVKEIAKSWGKTPQMIYNAIPRVVLKKARNKAKRNG